MSEQDQNVSTNVTPEQNVATVEDVNETNALPVLEVDNANLPTIPAEIPAVIAEYGEKGGMRGKLQIQHLKGYLEKIREFGSQLLSQHHAEGAAEQELETAPEYEAYRKALDAKDAEIESAQKALDARTAEYDKFKADTIAAIVGKANKDVNYEVAEIEYGTYLANLQGTYKSYEAAGASVQSALKSWVKEFPSARQLIDGTKKTTRKSNSTMPGSSNGNADGWKPRFDEIYMDGKLVEGVTSIGQLAKHYDNGKRYEKILGRLEDAVIKRHGSRTGITDGEEYTWTVSINNLDDNTETVTEFRGTAMSRAAANARANAAKEAAEKSEVSNNAPVESAATAESEPENNNPIFSEGNAAEDF